MSKEKQYYYNNRPIKILHKTTDNMYLISANTNAICETIEPASFCQTCMIGGNASHTCEEAGFIIEDIIDAVSQEDQVFWVDKKFITTEYFEFKKNQELQESIKNLSKQESELKSNISKLTEEKEKLQSESNSLKDNISISKDIMELLQLKIGKLKTKIENNQNLLGKISIESDIGLEIKIDAKEYIDLLAASYELQALNDGGVDNWDFYGEAIQSWFKDANDDEYSDEYFEADFNKEAKEEVGRMFLKAIKGE